MRRTRRHGSSLFRLLVTVVTAALVVTVANSKLAKRRISDRYDVKKVIVDLRQPVRIEPAVSARFPNGGTTFRAMMERLRPVAAINGTYYDKEYRPLGDIVIGGEVILRGAQHHAIAVDNSNRVSFREKPGRKKFNWKGYRAGLAAGPRLVHMGKASVDPVADGFSKYAKEKQAWRSAVGITRDNKLVMAVVQDLITLDEMAAIMIDLGAVEAMNLDGGGACALYHKGKYLADPSLPMTNVLAVYNK